MKNLFDIPILQVDKLFRLAHLLLLDYCVLDVTTNMFMFMLICFVE